MPSAPVDYKALYEKALLEAEQVRQQAAQTQQRAATHIAELTEKLTLSLFELDRLRRKLFGRSADNRSKYIDPNQIAIFDLGTSEEERQVSNQQAKEEFSQVKKDVEKGSKSTPKKREKTTRMELPVDLPRQEVVIHPTQDLTNYIRIGEEVIEVLEITPPAFYVKRIIRSKWALKTSAYTSNDFAEQSAPGVILAPSRTITGGIFGDTLLAYLVISKFVDPCVP